MEPAHSSLFESCVQTEPGKNAIESVGELGHCKGVILFADTADTPILLLIASDIKRLALNRLICADTTVASKRVKLAEIVGRIYYSCCWCDFNSSLQHYRIAKQLFPSRYKDYVTFAKIWYVKINLSSKWPYFAITDNPQSNENTRTYGPFPGRKAASDYISYLIEAFALCRQQCLIDDPEKAASCPYYQMHICGAPCAGKISRDEYIQRVRDAVAAAGGNRREYIEKFQDKMRAFSSNMEFEQAQIVKRQLDNIRLLEDRKFRWVCDVRELALLHIDKGPKIKIKGQKKKEQAYMAFLVSAGEIQCENFTLGQIPELTDKIKGKSLGRKSENQDIAEMMSLVGFALYRSKSSGVWLDCRKELSAEHILKTITEKSGSVNSQQ